VWDVKQPGIYAFYLAGGGLVGYSEVALHLFELGTFLAFAVVLATTLRGRFERRATDDRGRRLRRDSAVLLVGAVVPIGAVVAYLALHGQLETARWTYLDVTCVTTGIAGRPASRLIEGAAKTAARWACRWRSPGTAR
jgi:hypothetical protein